MTHSLSYSGTTPCFVAAALAAGLLVTAGHPARAQQGPQRIADNTSLRVVKSESALARLVTVHLDNVSLRQAVDTLAASAGVRLQYQGEQLNGVRKGVTLHAVSMPLGMALDRVLAGSGLQVLVVSNDFIAIRTGDAASGGARVADGDISGKVKNAKTGQPIAGATVTVDDATRGVVTDRDGAFRLPASAGEHTVFIRAIGFTRQVRRVRVEEGKTYTLELGLEPSTSVLNEVIVTGTVVATERKAIPNPITVITADEIEKRGITKLDQLLRGEVPGVIALEQGSAVYRSFVLGAAETSKIYARGTSSLNGSPTPMKTYIDGVELLDPSYLGTIDPKSIERIEIITGPQAATVYGSGAMGGVMQVFTKKGLGKRTPELTLNFKYGILENNISNGKTPSHSHSASVADGSGEFSYSGNLSYNYTGQWIPDLFMRHYGASVGVSYMRGPVTGSASVSTTSGMNGTGNSDVNGPLDRELYRSGEFFNPSVQFRYISISQIIAKSSSQTATVNADYRPFSIWRHSLTVGRTQTDFDLVPQAPVLTRPADTLFRFRSSTGRRTTFGYNTTLVPSMAGIVSSNITLGMTGSWGAQTQIVGSAPTKTASSLTSPTVSKLIDSESWGGFGQWQLGLFDRLYVTLGLRGERNPTYGRAHKIDWTPSNGVAYTLEMRDVTVKLLGSYGRATRPPSPDQRKEMIRFFAGLQPVTQVTSQLANEDLRPEYSHGPQGGLEVYLGTRASLTVNHYQQTVSDLIQLVTVDSVLLYVETPGDYGYIQQGRYINTATMRQKGWELTGSANLGPIDLRGTYSWTDSRVRSVNPAASQYIEPGRMFTEVPTHFGSVSAGYAFGRTSVQLNTSFMGKTLRDGYTGPQTLLLRYYPQNARLRMYLSRLSQSDAVTAQAGYAKTDLALSQQLTRGMSFTVNVVNLGNSFGSESSYAEPALGRQTLLGFSWRLP